MASKTFKNEPRSKAGMWSTVTAAVEGGWGSTVRLLTLLIPLGALVLGLAVATGESDLVGLLRALVVAK